MKKIRSHEIEIARELSRFDPGQLPLPIFLQIARLTVTPVIEVVPIKKRRDESISVLLTKRSEDDPVWPGMWHTPGTIIRAFDASITDGMNRLLATELANRNAGPPQYVGHMLHQVLRGVELALVHWVEVEDNIEVGTFFDIDQLPCDLVGSQRPFIFLAVDAYRRSQ
jgi:hypothetical protein